MIDKDLAKMNYSEFSQYFDAHDDNFEIVLDYNDFIVYKETKTYRYFFYETGENDASEFYELELIATAGYNPETEPTTENLLSFIPEAFCCGEPLLPSTGDGWITYYWFRRKK